MLSLHLLVSSVEVCDPVLHKSAKPQRVQVKDCRCGRTVQADMGLSAISIKERLGISITAACYSRTHFQTVLHAAEAQYNHCYIHKGQYIPLLHCFMFMSQTYQHGMHILLQQTWHLVQT